MELEHKLIGDVLHEALLAPLASGLAQSDLTSASPILIKNEK
jgi:hypothetical protein